ncbi:MAG: manganese catalase family protein [Clostridia bacterium]|nr:manganese catalase family protein [Clostridia bacterium]
MWKYEKKLQFPVNIKNKNVKMARYIITQTGGPNGELAAALRYMNQRYTMPDDYGKSELTDIATEELAHLEIINAMLYQLLDGATAEELEKEGLGSQYTEHKLGIYPENSAGVPFTVAYFAVTGNPMADISEDMAAEEKARATYENLMDLTDDPDILAPLSFLRQREIIHFERFKRLYEMYSEKYKKK